MKFYKVTQYTENRLEDFFFQNNDLKVNPKPRKVKFFWVEIN